MGCPSRGRYRTTGRVDASGDRYGGVVPAIAATVMMRPSGPIAHA